MVSLEWFLLWLFLKITWNYLELALESLHPIQLVMNDWVRSNGTILSDTISPHIPIFVLADFRFYCSKIWKIQIFDFLLDSSESKMDSNFFFYIRVIFNFREIPKTNFKTSWWNIYLKNRNFKKFFLHSIRNKILVGGIEFAKIVNLWFKSYEPCSIFRTSSFLDFFQNSIPSEN